MVIPVRSSKSTCTSCGQARSDRGGLKKAQNSGTVSEVYVD